MGVTRASQTALMVAGFRARATGQGLCADPWAILLAGDEGLALAARFEAGGWADGELWLGMRTAYIDDVVQRALDDGVRQVVVLGAGFDTRAARMARAGVRFWEVDQPASQAEKRSRIARIPGYPADAATFVQCDFEAEDFLDRLTAAGLDAAVPAVIVWEGVTMYLPEAVVRATLRRLAHGCHPRSTVVFDHVARAFAERRVKQAEAVELHAHLDHVGEPLRFGSDDVLPLLYEEGFRYVRTTTFDAIALERTGTYERSRGFRFQYITVASRQAP